MPHHAAGLAHAPEDEHLAQRRGTGSVQRDLELAVDHGTGRDDERFGPPDQLALVVDLDRDPPTGRTAPHVERHGSRRLDDVEPHPRADPHTDGHVVAGHEQRALGENRDQGAVDPGVQDADPEMPSPARPVGPHHDTDAAAGGVTADLEAGMAHRRGLGPWW